MAQPLRIKTDTDERIYNTEAYFLASPIIWTPSQTLIPIDGSNAGKRKVGNNIDTYTNLSFEGAGTGGASNTDELTNNSSVSGATASDALNTLLGADQSLDSEKQDKLLSILTINDDNHSLTGTEYFIRATGTDPTWVTDTGNLDPGYPLELANDSTNDLTFVPDSGSNIVLSPGERASLRHRSGGAWISMFSGVDTALAGKADLPITNTAAAPTAVLCTITGVTDGNGRLGVDFTAASGGRPAFSAVYFLGGGPATSGADLSALVHATTLAVYSVQYWDVPGATVAAADIDVSFTVLGIPV